DLKAPLAKGNSALGVVRGDDPRRFGVVEVEQGRIVRLVEKPADPPSDLAIVGVYYLRDSGRLFRALEQVVASGVRTRGEIQLTDALPVRVDEGEEIVPFPIEEWLDCGSPEGRAEAERRRLAQRAGGPAPGARRASRLRP